MQVELKANGKTVQVEMTEEQLKELGLIEEQRTGYERVEKYSVYFFNSGGGTHEVIDNKDKIDKANYDSGNYYSDCEIAKNNIRADKLLRQLRQWQAANDRAISAKAWKDGPFCFYNIRYNYWLDTPYVNMDGDRGLNNVYFTSEEKAKEAIKVFEDELLWYFTEYVQRLDEGQNG